MPTIPSASQISQMSSSTRSKYSVVGSLVSAPLKDYYYPGRIKTIKQSVDGSGALLYSVAFASPLGSFEEPEAAESNETLVIDFAASQLIGRGFESITQALLHANQKVFITYRGREVSGRVLRHENENDTVHLALDSEPVELSVRLAEIRLLPSRKSGRKADKHPDYSLLASGRLSPDMEMATSAPNASLLKSKGGGRRRTTSSSSILLSSNANTTTGNNDTWELMRSARGGGEPHKFAPISARIDVPGRPSGRKRRPDNSDEMNECAAAMVLMSLSASPRSPTFVTEHSKLYRCLWPGCVHETWDVSSIERHVRESHLNNDDNSDEEDFYFTEVDLHKNAASSAANEFKQHFSGSDSPLSLSEDAASTTSSGSIVMTNGENSMDSSPPSPMSNNSSHFFRTNTANAQVYYAHLEDHEYNRRPEPTLSISISRPRKKNYSGSLLSRSAGLGLPSSSSPSSSKPINIPNMNGRSITASRSFSESFSSSGFGSFSSGFSSMSPRSGGSLSSSLLSNKHLRIAHNGRPGGSSGSSILQSSASIINRTSPTKRVRGETRKCRKVYGMEKKDQWCTQCKWKKACTRFTD